MELDTRPPAFTRPRKQVKPQNMQYVGSDEGIGKAIALVGLTNLSGLLNVSLTCLCNWRTIKQTPAEYCPSIERITGGEVKCEELNPYVEWAFIRGTKKGLK